MIMIVVGGGWTVDGGWLTLERGSLLESSFEFGAKKERALWKEFASVF